MLFNSTIFIVFAILFFAVWPFVKSHKNSRWLYLIIASFIFYGWWDWRFLFLIIGSGLLDFFAGLGMHAYPSRKHFFLFLSILGNIGSLAIFKYSGFVAANLDILLRSLGIELNLEPQIPDFMLILPIGISFYTFQSMSYTIDIYRGQLWPTRNILHFFAYLSMFPQLVAGPIIRANVLLPQLETSHSSNESERWSGLKLIIKGYFKKVVLADNLAPLVTAAFSATTISHSTSYWWCIIIAFAFQIYCDFSGYSDIAIGLGKWMGYSFPINFNHPYVSTSLREFWQCWHISLSTWFRDYVYIPLGGSRTGQLRSQFNMWTTMIIAGLWHGANWNFIVWGLLHALFLSIERISKWPARLKLISGGKGLAAVVVMVQVLIAWVFFRAESFGQAITILKTMFSFTGPLSSGLGQNGSLFLAVAIFSQLPFYFQLEKRQFSPKFYVTVTPLLLALLAASCVYLRGPGSEFIYFQF